MLKLFKRTSRRKAKKLYRTRNLYRRAVWASKLKPGDFVSTCFSWPFNEKIVAVDQVEYRNPNENRKGTILWDLRVRTEDNRVHYLCGGGCLDEALHKEEIRKELLRSSLTDTLLQMKEYHKKWCPELSEEQQEKILLRTELEWVAAKTYGLFCDENGCRLSDEELK